MASLYDNVLRKDVFNSTLDDQVAPELSDVIRATNPQICPEQRSDQQTMSEQKTTPQIYVDPEEFFSSTYITDSMRRLVDEISVNLSQGKGITVPIFSLFGGGKTHTLIMIYHAFRRPDIAKKYGLNAIEGVKVVAIGGRDSCTAPSPESATDAKTLWGYIAKELGKYDVVKVYDEDLMPPPIDKLELLFKGQRVLLIIDEIAWYLSRFREAKSSNQRAYYTQCLNFFEVLAQVTTKLPVALVISIPGKYDNNEIEAEKGYEAVVDELSRRVLRVSTIYRAPIENEMDLANVLKKRIFEKIDENGKSYVKEEFSRYASKFKEYLDVDIEKKLPETYPFHPYYISTLKGLVENVKKFQRTRDALKITRKVVRKLWNARDRPIRSMVLPADIDIRDGDIETALVSDYPEYKNVIDAIKERTTNLDEIYFYLADYIFLNTYYMRLGFDAGRIILALPDSKNIVTAISDPLLLSKKHLTPSDIKAYLDELASDRSDHPLPYLRSEQDRYWFGYFIDPKKRCKEIKDKITRAEATQLLKKVIIEFATASREDIERSRRRVERKVSFLKLYDAVLDDIGQLIDLDEPSYYLVLIDKPLCNNCNSLEPQDKERIRRSIHYTSKNTLRKYNNTISVLFSLNGEAKREEIIERIKEYIACQRLIDEINQQNEDEIIKKKMIEVLNNRIKSLRESIYSAIVDQYYSHLAYPDGASDVKIVELSRQGETLVDRVWNTLIERGKVYTDESIDYDELMYHIEKTGVNSIEGLTFSRLKEMFLTNSRLPWVSETGLKKALIDGVRNRKIGLQSGQVVYFKVVEPSESDINDSTLIMSAIDTAKKEIEELLKEEIVEEGDKVKRKYYVLKTERGDELALTPSFTSRSDWFEIYKDSEILAKEEITESGVNVVITPKSLEGVEGEEKEISISVNKIGKFEGKVYLESSSGEVIPNEGLPPFEAKLKVRLGTELRDIRLKVKYGNKEKEEVIPVVVRRKDEVYELTSITPNVVVTEVKVLNFDNVRDTLDKIRVAITGRKVVDCTISIEKPDDVSITIRLKNWELARFIDFLSRQLNLVGAGMNPTVSGDLVVRIIDFKGLDKNLVSKLNDLIYKGVISVRGKAVP